MAKIEITGTKEELAKVSDLLNSNKIHHFFRENEEPIYLNINDIESSERINPYIIEGKKSKPVLLLLVDKYGEEKAMEIYNTILKNQTTPKV